MIVIFSFLCIVGKASGEKVIASWYDAPSRSSFASRNKSWRGKTFIITRGKMSVRVTCRDYGPAKWTKRHIDVSRDVAKKLGFIREGVTTVNIQRSSKNAYRK